MSNQEIKETAKNKGVFLWQIADALEISDSYFSKKLRKEFSETEKTRVLDIIDSIAAGRAE